MKSIETKELITAIEELEKERGISKEYLLSSLETALVTAYKRNFDVNTENVKITIQTKCDESSNQVKWLNGAFLVKLPEEILDLEINDVTIDNTNVTLTSYELVEQDGCKFIKIITNIISI